jgi:predicted RND superfamily exporter protein
MRFLRLRFRQWYLRYLGVWGVVPFALVTAAALALLPRTVINPVIQAEDPQGVPYFQTLRSTERNFAPGEFVLVAYAPKDLDSRPSLEGLRRLTYRLAALPGVRSAVSAATVNDLIARQ